MKEAKWEEHLGTKYIFVDYRGCKSAQEMIEVLHQEIDLEKASEGNVPCLANFEGTHVNSEYMEEVKKMGQEVRKEKVYRTGLIGFSPLKKIFLNAYVRFTGETNIRVFNSRDEALAWILEGL